MLDAARAGDWDQVVKLEGACVLLISQLKQAARDEPLAADEAGAQVAHHAAHPGQRRRDPPPGRTLAARTWTACCRQAHDAALSGEHRGTRMFQDTRPAPLGARRRHRCLGASSASQQPREIAALLKQLRDGSVPVTLSAPRRRRPDHGELWTLDTAQRRISFSADADSPQLQRLARVRRGRGRGLPRQREAAVRPARPGAGARRQRLRAAGATCRARCTASSAAAAFRVRTLERARAHGAAAPPVDPRHAAQRCACSTSAIGGCACCLPDDVPALKPGSDLRGVRIELDADTRFDADLLLHHVTLIQTPSRGARLGCEFMHVQPQAQRALQRYIDQTPKRRRLLSLE